MFSSSFLLLGMSGFVYDAKFRGARETSNVLKTAIDSRRKRTDFYFQMVHLEYKQLSDLKNHGYEESQWFKVEPVEIAAMSKMQLRTLLLIPLTFLP